MADLPELSDTQKRIRQIQWDTLREHVKLTDEDISGYDLGRQWLVGMLPKAPQGMNLGGLNTGHTIKDRKWAARRLGCDPSMKVAEGRFRGIDWEYWSHWCSSGEPYETYAVWLEALKREIVVELESAWKGRSALSDKWFEVACKPAIEKSLSALIKGRVVQARDFEVSRLYRKARTKVATIGATVNSKTDLSGNPHLEESDSQDVHQMRVAKVERNFGCDGKPGFLEFYRPIRPAVSAPEFSAWKRNDGKHCGKDKWEALDKRADSLN